MPSPAPTPKPTTNGWTPERKARQAAAIRFWAPWAQSTGPRSAAGKARSSRNASKPHTYAFALLKQALAVQRRCLAHVRLAAILEKTGQNELLALAARNFRRDDLRFRTLLHAAVDRLDSPQKSCVFRPPPANDYA